MNPDTHDPAPEIAPAAMARLIAHSDIRQLAAIIDRPDPDRCMTVRAAWAEWAAGSRRTWPDLTTCLTAFVHDHPVGIRTLPGRCSCCHGRMVDHRCAARGSRYCITCHGTGRGKRDTIRLRWR